MSEAAALDRDFVCVDLETTGGSAAWHRIIEIGVVEVDRDGTRREWSTLVNPGAPIPPMITYLTGITEAMVGPAPTIEAVLPSLLEFVGDAVIVGHNVGFDLRFLRAATERLAYPTLTNRVVDTCSLARRLVRDEVSNCKLQTQGSSTSPFRIRAREQPSSVSLIRA